MTKQKKLAKSEEYKTPLETLLSFLSLPYKIYRDIYIYITERRLSPTPLIQSDTSIAFLAREMGIEPALMSEKIRNMVRMKWIQYEQVGNRDTNQIFVLSPIWHFKPGIDEAQFAIAMRTYKMEIVEDKERQMSTTEVYELMNSICPHTSEKIDSELCEIRLWPECKTCTHKGRDNE